MPNYHSHNNDDAKKAFNNANLYWRGACVAACGNASASACLFSAKVVNFSFFATRQDRKLRSG